MSLGGGDRVRVLSGFYKGESGVVTAFGPGFDVYVRLQDGSEIVGSQQNLEKLDYEEFAVTGDSPRAEALDEAKELITGDRNSTYGPPTQDFKRSAEAMTAYGYRKLSPTGEVVPIESHDVAILIDVVKTSRLMWTPGKKDSWVDKAGYAGCGYECAVEEGYAVD